MPIPQTTILIPAEHVALYVSLVRFAGVAQTLQPNVEVIPEGDPSN